jgi:hypothetical protein
MAFNKGQTTNPRVKPLGALNQPPQASHELLWFKAVTLVLFIQGPSMRDWFKYIFKYISLPSKVLVGLIMVVSLSGYWFVLRCWPTLREGHLAALAASKWLFLGLWATVLLTMLLVYPMADALKFQMAGSDQDDALIIGAQDILAGSPYASKTYLGNPQSAGPGWVLLTMPFSLAGAYRLFFPGLLACLGLALKLRTGSWRTGNLFLLLAFTGLIFWDLTAVGSDVLTWGCAAALALILVEDFARRNPIHLTWLAMIVGCLATARIVFLPFPLLAGLFLWQRGDRKEALVIATGGIAVAVVLHLSFSLWTGGSYPPLHLIRKGSGLLDILPLWVLAPAIAAGCFLVLLVYHLAKGGLDRWMLAAWVAFGLPLALISFSDLITRHFDFALWAGANYLGPALPFLLCWMAWEEQGASPFRESRLFFRRRSVCN